MCVCVFYSHWCGVVVLFSLASLFISFPLPLFPRVHRRCLLDVQTSDKTWTVCDVIQDPECITHKHTTRTKNESHAPLTSAASGKRGLTNQHLIWWSASVNFNNATKYYQRVTLWLLHLCLSITKTPQEDFNPFTQWLEDHFKCGFSCCVLINSFHTQPLKTKVISLKKIIYIYKTLSQRRLKTGNFVTLSCLYCFYTFLYLECMLKNKSSLRFMKLLRLAWNMYFLH